MARILPRTTTADPESTPAKGRGTLWVGGPTGAESSGTREQTMLQSQERGHLRGDYTMDEARRERAAFIEAHVARIDPLMRDTYQADWDAAVTGSDADNDRVAKLTAELLGVYADAEAFGTVRAWDAAATGEALLDRQIHLL